MHVESESKQKKNVYAMFFKKLFIDAKIVPPGSPKRVDGGEF